MAENPPIQTTEHIDVGYVAHLARLELSDEETASFQSQLDNILGHVKELGALDVEGIEPTAHAIPVLNVLRADEPRPCLDHDTAMANAPEEKQGQFLVPRIIE